MHIIHCLRAPIGGLFRHVADLARAQEEAGHLVGVIVDRTSSDSLTGERLETLRRHLALGLHKIPMSRSLGPRDLGATIATARIVKRLSADVLHGHGAKGGAYARLAAACLAAVSSPVRCFYTPHGGSLHYPPTTLNGQLYMRLERLLCRWTTGIIFESDFSRRVYGEMIGEPSCATRVIPNGVLDNEFIVHEPNSDAADFLFVGELRMLKGIDVLLHAIAGLRAEHPVTARIVGDGPDASALRALAIELDLESAVSFLGAMPARQAFPLARVLVVPSRAESLPYIVLEAAAGRMPIIATSVGGIPEIVAGTGTPLVPADSIDALLDAMRQACKHPQSHISEAVALQKIIRSRFSVVAMTRAIEDFYSAAPAPLTRPANTLTYP